jgi:hypothetical protein
MFAFFTRAERRRPSYWIAVFLFWALVLYLLALGLRYLFFLGQIGDGVGVLVLAAVLVLAVHPNKWFLQFCGVIIERRQ